MSRASAAGAPSVEEPLSGEEFKRRLVARALKLLAARSRSESQIRERLLLMSPATAADVEECITTLKQMGVLNDRKFAESYAFYRADTKPMGRARMQRELAQKKLSRADINSALEDVYQPGVEQQLIRKAMQKRVRTRGVPVNDADIRRLYAYLMRLGFDSGLIASEMRSLRRTGFSFQDE